MAGELGALEPMTVRTTLERLGVADMAAGAVKEAIDAFGGGPANDSTDALAETGINIAVLVAAALAI
jgi:hypothetical protein